MLQFIKAYTLTTPNLFFGILKAILRQKKCFRWKYSFRFEKKSPDISYETPPEEYEMLII